MALAAVDGRPIDGATDPSNAHSAPAGRARHKESAKRRVRELAEDHCPRTHALARQPYREERTRDDNGNDERGS